jgi:hypothetical protein
VKMLKPSQKLPALTSVWIPDAMRLNDNVTPAGQTAGFLGTLWEPERFVGDPALPKYQIEGLSLLDGVTPVRMDRRQDMLRQLESQLGSVRIRQVESWDRLSRQAFDLVTSGEARAAFDLSREPDEVRDRYGRYTWGQSVLLARRLIEAGVRLVHVNWARSRRAGYSRFPPFVCGSAGASPSRGEWVKRPGNPVRTMLPQPVRAMLPRCGRARLPPSRLFAFSSVWLRLSRSFALPRGVD